MRPEETGTGRRRFIQLVGVASVGGLAGCASGADDDEEVEDDGTADENGASDEQSDDEQDGDTDNGQGDGEGTGDDNGSDNPQLRDVLAWEHSYVMEIGGPLGVGTVTVYEGDTYTVWDGGGMAMEAYRIGDESYVVVDGNCYKSAGDSEGDVFEPDDVVDESGEIRATAVETIDGQEVYRFDVDDGYLYLSTETGYPVRFEDREGAGLVEFHSWGETEPISPPDMECVEQ